MELFKTRVQTLSGATRFVCGWHNKNTSLANIQSLGCTATQIYNPWVAPQRKEIIPGLHLTYKEIIPGLHRNAYNPVLEGKRN